MSTDGLPHLAGRLTHLMETQPTASGGRYNNESLAAELRERGYNVTGGHISHMRHGTRDNPSARLIHGLSVVFGVPLNYFYDDDVQKIDAELNFLSTLSSSHIRTLLTRAQGVSPLSLEALNDIAANIRKLEGLDEQ